MAEQIGLRVKDGTRSRITALCKPGEPLVSVVYAALDALEKKNSNSDFRSSIDNDNSGGDYVMQSLHKHLNYMENILKNYSDTNSNLQYRVQALEIAMLEKRISALEAFFNNKDIKQEPTQNTVPESNPVTLEEKSISVIDAQNIESIPQSHSDGDEPKIKLNKPRRAKSALSESNAKPDSDVAPQPPTVIEAVAQVEPIINESSKQVSTSHQVSADVTAGKSKLKNTKSSTSKTRKAKKNASKMRFYVYPDDIKQTANRLKKEGKSISVIRQVIQNACGRAPGAKNMTRTLKNWSKTLAET